MKTKETDARKLNLGEAARLLSADYEKRRIQGLTPALVAEISVESSFMDVIDEALCAAAQITYPNGLERLFELFDKIEDVELRASIIDTFVQFCDAAILLGEFRTPREYMKRALTSKGQSNKGKKSGEARAKQAAETWHGIALKLAFASRQENEGGSLDFIAEYICSNWPSKKIRRPGHSRLKQVISQWIKDGTLPKKITQ